MRPLKLVMTGFESYKDKTEIEFEKLGTQGLYLITGDTGAGKTTIFDAITFALYGSPSGGDRSVEMLRSHFADENTPTRVELDFEVNGKKYHIVRNPEYERKALRGEGITVEAASASLQCENQEPISGLSKVNQEIEKLLNLRKEQFCSIAMIAQGRFQQLLLSKKDEKEKIFRELFHTEKYERLQNQLKTDKSEAERNVSDLHLRLSEALGRIEVSQQDSDFEKLHYSFNYQASGQWETIDFQDGTGLVYTRDASGNINIDNPIYGELDEIGRIKKALGGIADISLENKPLNEISVFIDYLSKLQDSDYTILLAVRDDGFGAINNSLAQSLQALGIKTEISGNIYRHSYYAVLSPDRDPVEEVSEQELDHAGNLPDGSTYRVTSCGMLTGAPLAFILIDGQEWSMNRRGMNFVVYDNAQHKVVDTVCFDTNSGLYAYRPPALPEQ